MPCLERRRYRPFRDSEGLDGDQSQDGEAAIQAATGDILLLPGEEGGGADVVLPEAAALRPRQESALGRMPRPLAQPDRDHGQRDELAGIVRAVAQVVGQQRDLAVQELRRLAVREGAEI